MSRFRLTFGVALLMTATYQLYAQWAVAFVRIESQARPPLSSAHAPAPPTTFESPAEQVLPDEDWIRNAGYTFQRGEELFLYANSAKPVQPASPDLEGNGGAERIELRPFVLIWKNPDQPDATPYVVRCDSARVQFENPVEISFDSESPGRLKAATFDGDVRISGPDGLRIEGERFDFSEESLSLYSGVPLWFSYGPTADSPDHVQGSASSGIRVDFIASAEPELGRDMPRIGGVERVRLLRNVVLDCVFEERDEKGAPQLATAHIQCDESFDFNAVDREAIFLKNVSVRRPTGGPEDPNEADTLRCHQLSLRFVESREAKDLPVDVANVGPPLLERKSDRSRRPFGGLRVKELNAQGDRASGNRATLESDSRQVIAQFQELVYDFDTSTATLSDTAEETDRVLIQRNTTYLHSPIVRLIRDQESDQQVLNCYGKGRLQHVDPETGAPLLDASWDAQLQAAPDPETRLLLVSMAENAKVFVEQRAGMRADQLFLWIDDHAALDEPVDAGRSVPGSRLAAAARAHGRFPLRHIEARGRVVMANVTAADSEGPPLYVETELLSADVSPGRLPVDEGDSAQGDEHADLEVEQGPRSGVEENQLAGAEETRPDEPPAPWRLASKKISLKLLNVPGTSDLQVAEAHAEGAVSALHEETKPDGTPYNTSLSGSQVWLINEGGTRQTVHVIGSPSFPSLLRRGDLLLECRDLQFDRAANRVKVAGEGLLQAPVYRDLNGASLDQPMVLDVKWAESMTFDGEQATFLKNVVLQLHDSVLQCDQMDVRLMQRLDFSSEEAESEEVAIRDVGCRNGVHVEIYDWEENRIVGIRKGDLAQFYLDYQSGDFQGEGPGKINHWSRSTGRRVAVAPTRPAQANTPAASSQLEWEHISVAFDDLLTGNFVHRFAKLHGRVRMIYAPVRHVSETFVRNDLSGRSPSVAHAVWLGCDVMSMELLPIPREANNQDATRDNYLIIAATGMCEMEGNLFHAKADNLSYDEYKGQFTLRGKGTREASIYYESQPGAGPRRYPGQTIQFFPKQGEVKVDKSSGFQGVQ